MKKYISVLTLFVLIISLCFVPDTIHAGMTPTAALMPNVTGMTKNAAVIELMKAGIKYNIKYVFDDLHDMETVISQSVKEGKTVKKDSTVTLQVGAVDNYKGELYKVPYFIGKKTSFLEAMKKTFVFEIKHEYSEYYDKDIIIDQYAKPGKIVPVGYKIYLTVSKGPNPKYHKEITEYCDKIGVTGIERQYLINAIKYIMKNVKALTPEEIMERLYENLHGIVVKDYVEGTGGEFSDKKIIIEKSRLDEFTILHEVLHAVSSSKADKSDGEIQKIGLFVQQSTNHMWSNNDGDRISEGYTDSIAGSISDNDLNKFVISDMVITDISKQASYTYEVYLANIVSCVTGNDIMEKMYFSEPEEHNNLVAQFDDMFGNGTWQRLLDYSVELIRGEANFYVNNEQTANKVKELCRLLVELMDKKLDYSIKSKAEFEKYLNDFKKFALLMPTYENGEAFEGMHALKTKVKKNIKTFKSLKESVLDEYEMPDLYNNKFEMNYKALIEKMNGGQVEIAEEYSREVPAGRVIRQNVKAGSLLDRNKPKKIIVTVSKGTYLGSNYFEFPDLKNWEAEYAIRAMEQMEMEVKVVYTDHPGYAFSVVYDTSIKPGTIVKKGSAVTLYIYRPVEEISN